MISIPKELTEDTLIDGLMGGAPWIKRLINERRCDVSFNYLEWVEPGGIAPLATLATINHWHTIPPTSTIYSYLQRMRFADMFGFTQRLEFVEHDPTGRFIPAVWVQKHDDIEPVVNDIKSILRRSHLEQGVQWATSWSLNELLGNVIVHARAPAGGLVFAQVFPSKDVVRIAVIQHETVEISQLPFPWHGTIISCTLDLGTKLDMEEILGHPDDLNDDDLWEVED